MGYFLVLGFGYPVLIKDRVFLYKYLQGNQSKRLIVQLHSISDKAPTQGKTMLRHSAIPILTSVQVYTAVLIIVL